MKLFTPLTLPAPDGDGLRLRNRTIVSPMCQYSVDARDGVPTAWHRQHLGAFAAGGFGLVVTESTGVEAAGRISPLDVGLYTDEQQRAHADLVSFAHALGAAAAVQLNHAGGKASSYPALPGRPAATVPVAEGGWRTSGVTATPVLPHFDAPQALDEAGTARVVAAFADAAARADSAGYDAVQVHAAHGYLLHQSYSPLTNPGAADRTRLVVDVVDAVRAVWPSTKPLGIRISASDWTEGGWTVDDSVALVRTLVADHGVTWVDVSSGGLGSPKIPVGPGYQVPLAARITEALTGTDAVVSAVGMIEDAAQAETIVTTGQAHAVSIGRAALRNPHWPAVAAARLGVPADQNPGAPQWHRANWSHA